jgi:hypothetical protein
MKSSLLLTFVGLIITVIGVVVWLRWRGAQVHEARAAFINAYQFPATLRGKLALKHTQLTPEQLDLVYSATRHFFLACLDVDAVKRGRSVGMPSRVVDDVWHDFMLMSREYTAFCNKAFGGYLHHAPDGEMNVSMSTALGNTLHAVKARKHSAAGSVAGRALLGGIPLLFAIDSALAIEGGFHHDADTIEAIEAKHNRAALLANGSCSAYTGSSSSAGTNCSWGFSGGDGAGCGDGGGGCGGGCGS